tara:strand:+ start:1133 stop:1675 length:543 start_codon:yes stop_codon:yes gene_type:complete
MKFLYSRIFIKQLFISVVIFALITLISIIFLFFYTGQTNYIKVPDLYGLNMSEVEKIIGEKKLNFEVSDSIFYDPAISPNTVVSQTPIKDKEVKKKRKIYLTINPSDFSNVIFPDLIQLTKRAAISQINALDLEMGNIEYVDNIGKDVVLEVKFNDSIIKSGQLIPKKSKIDLVLGNGNK